MAATPKRPFRHRQQAHQGRESHKQPFPVAQPRFHGLQGLGHPTRLVKGFSKKEQQQDHYRQEIVFRLFEEAQLREKILPIHPRSEGQSDGTQENSHAQGKADPIGNKDRQKCPPDLDGGGDEEQGSKHGRSLYQDERINANAL
jgi:hypothetical protein